MMPVQQMTPSTGQLNAQPSQHQLVEQQQIGQYPQFAHSGVHSGIQGGSHTSVPMDHTDGMGPTPLSMNDIHQQNGSVQQTNQKYRRKYKRLRKIVKQIIFINGAVCDEVVKVEEKLFRRKEERRFLLKKLFQLQTLSDASHAAAQSRSAKVLSVPGRSSKSSLPLAVQVAAGQKKIKKETAARKKAAKETAGPGEPKPKVKKKQNMVTKLVQPIPSDSSGRPIFPITLGGLTIHSLGEVIGDRPAFHTPNHIYPAGFCSTRLYGDLEDPSKQCMYTCKISEIEGKPGPMFEISPDDNPSVVISSDTPADCHRLLLEKINQSVGYELVEEKGKGAEFFGFSHPTIQNLIQNLPGVKKCTNYRLIRFEVWKPEYGEVTVPSENDASISYEALKKSPSFKYVFGNKDTAATPQTSGESTANLRLLLAKQ